MRKPNTNIATWGVVRSERKNLTLKIKRLNFQFRIFPVETQLAEGYFFKSRDDRF